MPPIISVTEIELYNFVIIIIFFQTDSVLAITSLWANTGLMLAHRQRRWPNVNPVLAQYLAFAEVVAILIIWSLLHYW